MYLIFIPVLVSETVIALGSLAKTPVGRHFLWAKAEKDTNPDPTQVWDNFTKEGYKLPPAGVRPFATFNGLSPDYPDKVLVYFANVAPDEVIERLTGDDIRQADFVTAMLTKATVEVMGGMVAAMAKAKQPGDIVEVDAPPAPQAGDPPAPMIGDPQMPTTIGGGANSSVVAETAPVAEISAPAEIPPNAG